MKVKGKKRRIERERDKRRRHVGESRFDGEKVQRLKMMKKKKKRRKKIICVKCLNHTILLHVAGS